MIPASPATLFDLSDKVAMVTGASSGLGVDFALTLRAAGATVVVAARRTERLVALAAENDGLHPVTCDVADEESITAAVAEVLEQHGRIDVLVNNAGTGSYGPAEYEPIADLRRVMDVNLIGAFALCQHVGRAMLTAGSGSIINVSSVLGTVASAPVPGAAYCASKGALTQLTRELAVQWAGRGVRVNTLAPGYFPSELSNDLLNNDFGKKHVARNTPLGRPGRAGELAGPLLLLASDAGSYMTGHLLTVDGGWTAH